ncbi:SDR family NAD(P)-dependent oxidoreductase [Acaryochloris sp. IP29b_bin.148]|uniref:SDR family oxidoreductase n=1 Tax=Acaryochloris sp. IP29b_bin.148 TaxID=2969218 RepID=UPI0026176B9F|nr:SDR family NAD(P)-dependent oxidoreductase [Acaryochloris sp. IP29b_bin.148]
MACRIVITGVTQGLGKALTIGLIQQGHTVWGCGRTATAIDDLAQQFAAPHDFAVVDISQAQQVQAWAERLMEKGGTPDIVINNAGQINDVAPLWEIADQTISQVLDVNIKGTIHVIRSFLPRMAIQGQGIIVNFSSGWGRSTSPGVAPYCASKWAIEGLNRALAQEVPAGIATVALNPGIIDTEMLETCFGEQAHHYPSPTVWAQQAVPFILNLSAQDNGQALTVPH